MTIQGMAALLVLTASTAQAAIIVNVHDQSTTAVGFPHFGPHFGQPVITGNRADFPDTFFHGPSVAGVGDMQDAFIELGLSPLGTYRVTVGGGSYGVMNTNYLVALGHTASTSIVSAGIGPWEHSVEVEIDSLAGDFNGDGGVNAADYTVWRNNGLNRQQYEVWRDQYGQVQLSIDMLLVAGLPVGTPFGQPPTFGVDHLSVELVEPLIVPSPDSRELAGYVVCIWIGFLIGVPRRR